MRFKSQYAVVVVPLLLVVACGAESDGAGGASGDSGGKSGDSEVGPLKSRMCTSAFADALGQFFYAPVSGPLEFDGADAANGCSFEDAEGFDPVVTIAGYPPVDEPALNDVEQYSAAFAVDSRSTVSSVDAGRPDWTAYIVVGSDPSASSEALVFSDDAFYRMLYTNPIDTELNVPAYQAEALAGQMVEYLTGRGDDLSTVDVPNAGG